MGSYKVVIITVHQHNLRILTRESHGHKNSSQQHSHELGHTSEWCYQSLYFTPGFTKIQNRIIINTVIANMTVAICFIVDTKVLPFVFILELQAHNIFLNVQSQISSITTDVITDQSFGHKDDWQNQWKAIEKKNNVVGFHTLNNNLSVRWLYIFPLVTNTSLKGFIERQRGECPLFFPDCLFF